MCIRDRVRGVPLPAREDSPMIEAHNLTKRYGSTLAVDSVNFTVQPGKVTGFLGPNGAGKSTTMRIIVGLDRPTHGSVTLNGRPYAKLRSPLTEVGALLEAKAVHTGRSAANHLRALAATQGIGRARVNEVIEMTACRQSPTSGSVASRSAWASGSVLPRHSSATRAHSSSTSRSTGSTPKASSGSATWCATSRPRAAPYSSPRT